MRATVLVVACALACLAALAACGPRRTEIVLVVDSTLAVPVELDRVEFEVTGTAAQTRAQALAGPGARAFPLVLPLAARADDPAGVVTVRVRGTRNGTTVVQREARVRFAPEERRMLRVTLARACVGVLDRCGEGEACTEAGCVPRDLTAVALPPWPGSPPPTLADAGAPPRVPECRASCSTYAPVPRRFASTNLGAPAPITGLAFSRRFPDTLYAVTEEAGPPYVFHLNGAGVVLATYELRGVVKRDWEELIVVEAPGGEPYIYVLDSPGEPDPCRRTPRLIYRVPEPASMPAPGGPPAPVTVEQIAFEFPESAEVGEAIAIDRAGDIYVTSRTLWREDDPARCRPTTYAAGLYLVPPAGSPDRVARRVASLMAPPGVPAAVQMGVRALQVHACSSRVMAPVYPVDAPPDVNTPHPALMFEYQADGTRTLAELVRSAPQRVPLAPEDWAAEAVTYVPDGRGYVTVSYHREPVFGFVGCAN